MIARIDNDHRRFRDIVRGRIRENLRKYVSRGDMVARKGKDSVTIPMPQIDIPRFTYGDNQGGEGGVGQGEGEVGDKVGGEPQEGDGSGKAGEGEGEKAVEVEVRLRSLRDLGEELGCRASSQGKNLETVRDRYRGCEPRAGEPEELQGDLPRR